MFARRLFSLTAGCALFASSGAWADGDVEVIWDAPPVGGLPYFIDQQFEAEFAEVSTYLVAHVRLDRPYFLYDITTYYTHFNNDWPLGPIGAALNIYNQDGSLPSNDDVPPQAEVTANLAGFDHVLTYSAEGSIELAAGNYWIGLTPSINFGRFGQEYHQGSDFFLKNTAARNPGGVFGFGTDWFDAGQTFGGIDWGMAITITGKNVPTPGALALLGLAGLVGTRRRRPQ